MFLPATKIRVIESTAGHGKTKLKKGSLLYIVKSGGLYSPTDYDLRSKFNGSIMVMPALVVATRYGNELNRRAEVKPISFVFPFVDNGKQDKGRCIKNILTELKEYNKAKKLLNIWSCNKHGKCVENIDHVVGYPTLEETDPNTPKELAAWLFALINNVLDYYKTLLNKSIQDRQRVLNDIYAVFPELRENIIPSEFGSFRCRHFNDMIKFVDSIYYDSNRRTLIKNWALSHKALMLRRLFLHNAPVYEGASSLRGAIVSAALTPRPIDLKSSGWEQMQRRSVNRYKKVRYTWTAATNNLPVNYKGDDYSRIMPWVEYFNETSKGNL